MEKLLKTGIVDMELLVDKLNDMSLRRQIWYELGNIYRFMMDIKYDHHVLNKKKVSESGSKIINEHSKTSISYYLKFINSFELYVKYHIVIITNYYSIVNVLFVFINDS